VNISAILLGIGAAVFFAVGAAMEQTSTEQEKPARTLDPRLMLRLLRRPRWVLGWVPEVAGTILQALALRIGALALVEPLLLAGVFVAVPLAAAFNRQRPAARDFVVVALGVVGLTAFLVAASPQAGVNQAPITAWLPVIAAIAAVFAACLVVAWRAQGAARGTLLGIGAGLLYGFDASLLKSITAQLGAGLGALLSSWHVYALIVVGIVAVTLNQNAFQSGRIAASLTPIAVVDPIVGVAIGVAVYQERLSVYGARIPVVIAAAALLGYTLWFARRSR
jgi:hypothetical protein